MEIWLTVRASVIDAVADTLLWLLQYAPFFTTCECGAVMLSAESICLSVHPSCCNFLNVWTAESWCLIFRSSSYIKMTAGSHGHMSWCRSGWCVLRRVCVSCSPVLCFRLKGHLGLLSSFYCILLPKFALDNDSWKQFKARSSSNFNTMSSIFL